MTEQTAENACPCGRGPGHVRIKAAGCTPSAENDALSFLDDVAPPTRHAFWGTDPSGYCGCEDCEPTRPIPPAENDRSDRAKDWANTRYYLGQWWRQVKRLIRPIPPDEGELRT